MGSTVRLPFALRKAVPEFFFDDELVESSRWLSHYVEPPVKTTPTPLVAPDRPWEGNLVTAFGSVIPDPETGLLRMWYAVYSRYDPDPMLRGLVCYATSSDGWRWEKPDLGLVEFRGSRHNNIVLASGERRFDSPCILLDRNAPDPDRRYKMSQCESDREQGRGIYTYTSPDGLHWTRSPEVAVASSDRNTLFWDPFRKRYCITTRKYPEDRRRTVWLWESEDFVHWSEGERMFAPDWDDPITVEFYSMLNFPLGNHMFGFIELYDSAMRPGVSAYAKVWTELCASRDLRRWTRLALRQPYLDNGPEGSFDSGWVFPTTNPPIVRAGRTLLYYSGRTARHSTYTYGGVGLAVHPPGRIVGLRAALPWGELETRPILWPGGSLYVNLDALGDLEAYAEVADAETGRPVPGMSTDDCLPIAARFVSDVRWKSDARMEALEGRPLRLRFRFKGGVLYSYGARPEGEEDMARLTTGWPA